MAQHEEKSCPRCHSRFECKVGSINLCQCATVMLKASEREYVASLFDDCLCANCMRDLQQIHSDNIRQERIQKIRKSR